VKPKPWSFSIISEFANCPWQYHEKRISKTVVEAKSAEQLWGTNVHKVFENRQRYQRPLPHDLREHEPYMAKIEAWAGTLGVESQIALNKKILPCGYWDDDAWFRGVMDFCKIDGATARLVDYKTGKRKEKWEQLMMVAIYIFIKYPAVQTIDARFYWTVDKTDSRKVWGRAETPALWGSFIGDLKQFAQAFKTDTWQKRPSGLCPWCPVTSCEFWKPRRAH
jgi:hypothetical protein